MRTLLSRRAFTLLELLVSVVIIGILCMLGLAIYGTVIDRARCTKDMAQMRTIAAAVLARAGDNNGYGYTRAEVGNSSYRVYKDKYSLCQILLPYLGDKQTWTSPKPHPRTIAYGNSYAWSRAANVVDKPILGSPSDLNDLILLWNNHSFITPSPSNYPDPSPSGGPSSASPANQVKPWRRGKAQNWAYADGHVETR